jgi:tRNA threonylcarbamoyladenosine biosynthesis protein TsaB
LDARKGEVYTALYYNGKKGRVEQVTPYQVLSPTVLLEQLPPQETVFLGNGVQVYGEFIRGHLGEKALFAPPHLRFLRGSTVAELGLGRIMQGEQDDISSMVPIYVRPSDAEINWARGKRG